MKFVVAIIALITATHAREPENPDFEGLEVKYLDVTWAEHLLLDPNEGTTEETYKFVNLPEAEVQELRGREVPDGGFWFNPDYVANPAAKATDRMPFK